MLKIFSFFYVIFSFILISGHNAIHNDQNSIKKAILLALLKNKFIDKKEYTKYDDINNAYQYIKNSGLNINDVNKFENFLSHLLKHHNINATFNDVDTKILYLSGILNSIYVDLDSLDKDYVDTYFNNNHEQSSNIIKLILRSKAVTPEYINTPYKEETYEKDNDNLLDEKHEEIHENDEGKKNENEIFDNNEEYKIENLSEEIDKINDYIYSFIGKINDEIKMNNMENYIKDYPIVDDTKTKHKRDNIIINIYNTYFGYGDPNAVENPQKLSNKHPYIANLNLQIGNNTLKDANELNTKFNEKHNYIGYNENKDDIQSFDNKNFKDYDEKIDNKIEDYNNDLYAKGENEPLTFHYTYENPYSIFTLRNSLSDQNKEKDSNSDVNIDNNNENMDEQNNKIDTSDSKDDFNDIFASSTSNTAVVNDNDGKNNKNLHALSNSSEHRPVYKRKEFKAKKMKTITDIIDNKTLDTIQNRMYVKIGQNGANNFSSFFEFRGLSLNRNLRNLLIFIDYLKIFNTTEAIVFIEKITQLICVSYCMTITNTLELSNNDMLLYDGMTILFSEKSIDVKINAKIYHIKPQDFKTILGLLNINKKTIPLVCPCKSYSNTILSYFKDYGTNARCSYYHYDNPLYLEEYSPFYVLSQLISMQEKLPFIKKNGKPKSKLIVDGNGESDIYSTIFYHNYRHSLHTKKRKSNKTNKIDKSIDENNDGINVYYNASLININDTNDITNMFVDEIKSKVSRINSYKIGKQVFTTYGNHGKDDHDLELKDTMHDPNNSRSRRLNNYVNNKNEKTKNDPNTIKNVVHSQLNTNNENKNKNDNASNVEYSSLINDNDQKNKLLAEFLKLENYVKPKNDVQNERDNKVTETNINKIINAKHLVQFFKGTEIWKPLVYCQHLAHINMALNNIKYKETITFVENLDNNQVVLYFPNNAKNPITINIEYFMFLLEKVSLVNYVEDLCKNFELNAIPKTGRIDPNLVSISNIQSFLEKNIVKFGDQFLQRNKYANELYNISTSNMFSSKRDIILNTESYNNIVFNEKDIFDIFRLYLEEIITEKMIEERFFTPFAFIIHKEEMSKNEKSTLHVYNNENIKKGNKGAINKYMFYGYKNIINNISDYYDDIIPNVPLKKQDLKEYTLVIYSDNPSMTNIVIKTTINVINVAFLLSILELVLDTKAEYQFFSREKKFFPLNSFIILNDDVNYFFFNYMPNENGSESQL
ncbi:conserved Plasmodium protein, unknown function [Plasmodium vinckei vinckei]|uniref:Merozoite surface protein MSA180 n=1 Tax=Plasmodium vinckei vinckei TaxID=54757 RepID=A0A449BWC0_PLAVN|nr:conserved Plasmodium protein, unknown function [Plasmodium vinckei vinckei]KEG03443.1 hypothetical protein YYE_01467 [Plasmodium vinckei vinckei]VEV57734.1 conserved Plasmodium protein, unknown function [Plasmodium vinckei vinckei]